MSLNPLTGTRGMRSLVDLLTLLVLGARDADVLAVAKALDFKVDGIVRLPPTLNVNRRFALTTAGRVSIFLAEGTSVANASQLLGSWSLTTHLSNGVRVPLSLYAELLGGDDLSMIVNGAKEGTVLLCGHSLGGAYLSTAFQLLAAEAPGTPVWCFTVGCPRCVGGPAFGGSAQSYLLGFQNEDDGVTDLPAQLRNSPILNLLTQRIIVDPEPWRPHGNIFHIFPSGDLRPGPAPLRGIANPGMDIEQWALLDSGVTARNHALTAYARSVRVAQLQAEVDFVEAGVVLVPPPDSAGPPPLAGGGFIPGMPDPWAIAGVPSMSVSMPRIDRTLLPSIVRNGPDDFLVRWMGYGLAAYRTKAQAIIARRDLSRTVRRLCGGSFLAEPPLVAAFSAFLQRASVDDGSIVPPANVVQFGA